MIRVVVVEDQTIVRQGLRSVLGISGDIEVVGEAADGIEALEVIERTQPDVVLLDLRMPRLDGVGVLKRLSAAGKLPPTLVLTTFDDDTALFDAIRAGAKGFLLKDCSHERLARSVRDIAAGRTAIEPVVTERILRAVEAAPPLPFESAEIIEPLTGREAAIVRLLAGGYSNREIGDLLNLGEGTIKNHISNVLSKLGVRDRTRAVLKAIDLGYI